MHARDPQEQFPSSLTSRQFCQAMEHAAIGTALVSLEGRVLHANAALRELFGFAAGEMTALSVADLTHPEDLDADLAQLADLNAGRIPSYRMEKRYIRRDGGLVWAELNVAVVRDEDGAAEYFIAQVQDISERRAAEQERARLVDRLTVATEAGQVGIWEWEFESGRIDWNPKMYALYDVPSDQPLSFEDFRARVHPEDGPRVDATIAQARAGGPYDVEFRVITAARDERRIHAQARVLYDGDGRPERMIGSNLDITELRSLAEQAQAASEAKSQFLATMSHEIRTPLNGILGVAGALALTPLGETQREMVSIIESSGASLTTLLSDILDLARVEAGKIELEPETFDLAAAVRACAALFDAAAQAKGLTLKVDIAPEAAGGYVGDAARLRQILCNLLGNAVKFTAEGEIAVRVAAAPGEGVTRLNFEVVDSGIGFDQETKERLFSPFEQADGSITRKFGGSGLGLSISRALARAMGGELTADSAPGRGATFTLALDLARGAAPAAAVDAAPRADATADLAGLRVLLAEDHPVNQRVIKMILDCAGVELTCVDDGAQALEAFVGGDFDVVLMDMQMPVMDGLTAIARIRDWEAETGAARTAIYILSANAMAEHVTASYRSGADGHISKPIVAATLLERLADVGRQAGAAAPAREAARRA